MLKPRLSPYRYQAGQQVSLCGFQATVHQRLRTALGRAMYVVQLAGETGTRHIMEDGLRAAEQMQVAA